MLLLLANPTTTSLANRLDSFGKRSVKTLGATNRQHRSNTKRVGGHKDDLQLTAKANRAVVTVLVTLMSRNQATTDDSDAEAGETIPKYCIQRLSHAQTKVGPRCANQSVSSAATYGCDAYNHRWSQRFSSKNLLITSPLSHPLIGRHKDLCRTSYVRKSSVNGKPNRRKSSSGGLPCRPEMTG